MKVRSLGWCIAACSVLALLCLFWPAPVRAGKDKDGKLTFEVYKDNAGEYRWRLKSASGKILAVPEDAYKNHSDVKSAIKSIQTNIAKMKTEYSKDKAKKHRWQLKATNGRVMARSPEGYKSKEDAEKVVELVRKGVKNAEVTEKK
jgi:uncharacterized protein YegP (UPF0339 family)